MKQFPFYDVTIFVSVSGAKDKKFARAIDYRQCTREKLLENETLAPILEDLEASIDED